MGYFDGVQFTDSLFLIILLVLLIFGSTDLENLTNAPY